MLISKERVPSGGKLKRSAMRKVRSCHKLKKQTTGQSYDQIMALFFLIPFLQRTHAYTHTHTHIRTHAHTQTHTPLSLSLSFSFYPGFTLQLFIFAKLASSGIKVKEIFSFSLFPSVTPSFFTLITFCPSFLLI